MSSTPILVLCTVPHDALAERIAHALLHGRAAACVNISSPVRSMYRWQGKVESATEHKLFIKTTRDKWTDVVRIITQEHEYKVPEIQALDVTSISEPYLAWLLEETR